MKPVNLTPTGAPAVQMSSGSGPGRQALLGVAGIVLVCGVSGYFAFAQVSSINDEAAMLAKQQADIDQQHSDVQAQIAELGRKNTSEAVSFSTVADTYERDVINRVTTRTDYNRLLRDLGIAAHAVPGAWFTEVSSGGASASSAPTESSTSEGQSVTVSGYAASVTDVLALQNNLNATATIADVELTGFPEPVKASGGKRSYVSFEMKLTFSASLGSAGGSSGLVSTQSQQLSLDPVPRPGRAKRTSVTKKNLSGVVGLEAATSNKRGDA